MILTHYANDLNVDHRRVHPAVGDLARWRGASIGEAAVEAFMVARVTL